MAVNWIATFPEWLESGSCEPVRSSKVFRPTPRLSARSKVLSLSNIQINDPEFSPYAITRGKLIRMKSQKIKSANILSQHYLWSLKKI
jgi:hypothetical protein